MVSGTDVIVRIMSITIHWRDNVRPARILNTVFCDSCDIINQVFDSKGGVR
jgi:hypothetical protein